MKRPFRGLRDREPRERYDTVIIGAGIGGLFCANLLAREGLRVLLLERHYMVGGFCSTFKRAGYTFDAATHFYPLLGNPETLTGKVLRDLGIETGWVKMDPVDTFHLPDGSRFAVPADLGRYLERLRRRFPAEAAGIDRFFSEVREAYLLGLLYFFKDRKRDRLGRFLDLSLGEVLDRHFQDPRLKLLLTADCPHWGSPPSRISFVFDSMLRLSYFLGNYYPEMGSQAFADALAERFERMGGDILISTEAEEILVREGAASGVRMRTLRGPLKGRREVSAGAVVSNADLLQTVHRLIPKSARDEAYLRRLGKLRPSYPCFLSYVGLRDVPNEVLHAAQGYYWQGWDPDRVGRSSLACKIFSPTLYEPRIAPPGGQIVLLQKVVEVDYDAVEDWPARKAEMEAFVTAHLRRAIPGVEKRIVVQESATARTSWQFTGNHRGAMLGWEMAPDQLGEGRPGTEGPLEGLYLVGHWTRPGGGITPVIVSAEKVAAKVAARTPGQERALEVELRRAEEGLGLDWRALEGGELGMSNPPA